MKLPTSIRLSVEATWLWRAIAKKLGIGLAAALEIAIRKLAEAEEIKYGNTTTRIQNRDKPND